jgi:hypothetical protein
MVPGLAAELLELEGETFEVTDVAELSVELGSPASSSCACSSTCSCSTSSCCNTTSTSCSSTGSCA